MVGAMCEKCRPVLEVCGVVPRRRSGGVERAMELMGLGEDGVDRKGSLFGDDDEEGGELRVTPRKELFGGSEEDIRSSSEIEHTQTPRNTSPVSNKDTSAKFERAASGNFDILGSEGCERNFVGRLITDPRSPDPIPPSPQTPLSDAPNASHDVSVSTTISALCSALVSSPYVNPSGVKLLVYNPVCAHALKTIVEGDEFALLTARKGVEHYTKKVASYIIKECEGDDGKLWRAFKGKGGERWYMDGGDTVWGQVMAPFEVPGVENGDEEIVGRGAEVLLCVGNVWSWCKGGKEGGGNKEIGEAERGVKD